MLIFSRWEIRREILPGFTLKTYYIPEVGLSVYLFTLKMLPTVILNKFIIIMNNNNNSINSIQGSSQNELIHHLFPWNWKWLHTELCTFNCNALKVLFCWPWLIPWMLRHRYWTGSGEAESQNRCLPLVVQLPGTMKTHSELPSTPYVHWIRMFNVTD